MDTKPSKFTYKRLKRLGKDLKDMQNWIARRGAPGFTAQAAEVAAAAAGWTPLGKWPPR